MKVAVEVAEATDLLRKDGRGMANPFVEVELNGQRGRTRSKPGDLNPTWNETLFFDVADPLDLPRRTILVSVYHDRSSSGDLRRPELLGRVRLFGSSVAPSAPDAALQRCPLGRPRGLFFSGPRAGELSLRLFAVPNSSSFPATGDSESNTTAAAAGDPEFNSAAFTTAATHDDAEEDPLPPPSQPKPKRHTNDQSRVFHSIGTSTTKHSKNRFHNHQPQLAPPQPASALFHAPFSSLSNPNDLLIPNPQPAFLLRRQRRLAGDKRRVGTAYDLVDEMIFLYVNIVCARNLPPLELTGGVDPFVEVRVGNYSGKTKHLEKNHNPDWQQVFAFSEARLESHSLEVLVCDHHRLGDGLVGKLVIQLVDVPSRVPPGGPVAAEWHRLRDRKGDALPRGELMLAVWFGTQADEAYPDAWHSDAHTISFDALVNTRSKVYYSPRLCYLRVHVISAQDLLPTEPNRVNPEAYVTVQLGFQIRFTRVSPTRSVNPVWNEELFLVAADPFDEPVVVTVADRVAPQKDVTMGQLALAQSKIQSRRGHHGRIPPQWFDLTKPGWLSEDSDSSEGSRRGRELRFSSKLQLRVYYDSGYHVIDELAHFSSDFQPTSKPLQLQRPAIGTLDLGILGARNLQYSNVYCVAKYGLKWVRTRTFVNTTNPRWNEQYKWDVFDPCTVLTVAAFENCHVNNGGKSSRTTGKDDKNSRPTGKDEWVGKIRIRLSTLEADREYYDYYPLLVIQPSGLQKSGELHLALRFSCTRWLAMASLYAKPPLPKMHYIEPIPQPHQIYLRHHAVQLITAKLARSEPPLRMEVVEYMLDADINRDHNMFTVRRSKANINRIAALFPSPGAAVRWFDSIRDWSNPVATSLFLVLFLILVWKPEVILPTFFLYLLATGLWNYRDRPRGPARIDTKLSCAEGASVDEFREDFDTLPTRSPEDVVRQRYERLRVNAGRVQALVGGVATQAERAQALLSWRDPRATAIFVVFAVVCSAVLYTWGFKWVATVMGLYLLRPPRFRSKVPSIPYNFFRRLPSKADVLL